MERIFLSPPYLSGQEMEYISRAVASNYIAPLGPDLDAFEQDMRERLGPVHCVGLSSGTAAIHLAVILAGIEAGDEVLCSDLTFVASITPVTWQGARPVFVDAERRTWNLDLDLAEEYLSTGRGRPKALLLTHLYGQPVDLDRATALCERYGLVLIEDAAEALGSSFQGRPCGTAGRFGVLSFNGNKIITTSGGGMLLCQDEAEAKQARYLATQARDAVPYYRHSRLGFNYRLSNICAALGRAQLAGLDERVARRRAISQGYQDRLAGLGGIEFLSDPPGCVANHWLSCVLFADGPKKGVTLPDVVREALEAENIEARPIWNPMHCQPVFQGSRVLGGAVGEDIFARGLCLPSGTALTEAEIDRICRIITSAVEIYRL